MTIEAFDALFTIQNESCAVCLAELPLWRDRHVDHCHTTGRSQGHCLWVLQPGYRLRQGKPQSTARDGWLSRG